MKRTFEERKRFIDRLERNYVQKVRLHNPEKQLGIKSAFRRIRGKYFEFEDVYSSPSEEFFHRGRRTA